MDTAELLRRVRAIEIKTRRLSRHLLTGSYHAAFKGRGMSFSEVRAYQFGDDVRAIDWNVTARTGEPHLKIFEEERELNVLLVVDVSASVFFGTGAGPSKHEFLTELCAVLAFSAANNHDKIGLLLYSDRAEVYVPPATGRQHVLRIIRELLCVQVRPLQAGTDLSAAIRHAHRLLKKRSVVFLLSDFQSVTPFETAWRALSKRHDCAGIGTWDARERELPDLNLVQVTDPETGHLEWADTADPDLRQQYTQRFDARVAATQATFRAAGADLLTFRSDADYATELLQFFERRAHRD
jgi:uncharacterized protein (DUF58 family)